MAVGRVWHSGQMEKGDLGAGGDLFTPSVGSARTARVLGNMVIRALPTTTVHSASAFQSGRRLVFAIVLKYSVIDADKPKY